MDDDRRLIEETFPIKEVSQNSREEKEQRRNNITTLHNWWARRPLSSSRATIYASLISDSKKFSNSYSKIIELSKVKNQQNWELLKHFKNEIKKFNNNSAPKIIDPFAGGGSIPLEALRLGCDVYSNDYNPISVVIQKCMLEFPKKFNNYKLTNGIVAQRENDRLQKEVKKWSEWILEKVKKDLDKFYSVHNGNKQVSCIWCWTTPCLNPSCGVRIPLIRNFWLSTKKSKSVALFPEIQKKNISFKLVGNEYDTIPKGFEPSHGTIRKSVVTCPICKTNMKTSEIRKGFLELKNNQRLLVLIFNPKHKAGKEYRIANDNDSRLFENATKYLIEKQNNISKKFNIDSIPSEPIPQGGGSGAERAFSLKNYGINTWGDLYNPRQKLIMITFLEKIREAYQSMLELKYEKEFAKAIFTYLCLIHSKLADWNCILTTWLSYMEKQGHTFSQQTLSITYDYCENNPLEKTSGSWSITTDVVMGSLNVFPFDSGNLVKITKFSATSLKYDDNFFDAVFTDPPYYDNIPYSYLSDFFYIWQKRTLGFIYPELFSTPLTPKNEEIVLYTLNHTWKEAKTLFEENLYQTFKEIYRILKPNGITSIVYAHKTTEAWESLIDSLLNSGLIVTAAWPINTEMRMRLRSQESAALASSIYMVCRKWKKEPHESYNNVKKQMQEYLDKKLDFLWSQDIRGADFFISAIGSAIEVFGKYEKITDNADNEIKVPQLLEDVRKIVSEYSIKKVLRGDIGGEISTMTRFYVLWRSAYGQVKVPFDDARKLATSLGINLEQEWNKGFIKKDKEFIRVIGPEDRSVDEIKDPTELIDVLHKVLILWRNNKKEEYEKLLTETEYANNDTFKRVAQAISESLPDETQEKKWIDGFLTGFTDSDKIDGKQTKLF